MAETRLEKLDSRMRPLVEELLKRAQEVGMYVAVINTLRSTEEQERHLAAGTSWTLRSLHLPQPPEGLSLAVDLAPVNLLCKKGWAPEDKQWQVLGELGESLGLKWGGRWKQRDMGHFEFPVLRV